MVKPKGSTLIANGLSHHVICWDGGGETIVLCHGFLDIAWSFDACARALSDAGYTVFAFDWRGHGQTEWIGKGGYYHFADYVLDLELLLPQLSDDKVHLLGHSMGGTVCALYGGVRSARLKTLTLVEGLGPPSFPVDKSVSRVDGWLNSVIRMRSKDPRVMADVNEALKRMRVQNPKLPDDLGLFLAERSTKSADDGQGLLWAFDPMHLTTSPMPFRVDGFLPFLKNISVPTLIVLGDNGYRLADEDDRLRDIPNAKTIEFANAGHMVHWFQPKELAAQILAHIGKHAGG